MSVNKFICNFCDNIFVQKKNLQRHINEKRCKSKLINDNYNINEKFKEFKEEILKLKQENIDDNTKIKKEYINDNTKLQQEIQRYINETTKLKQELINNIDETTKLKEEIRELHKENNNFGTEEELNEHINQSDITLKDKLIDIYIKVNKKVKDKLNMDKLKKSINKLIEKQFKSYNFTYKKYIMPSGKLVNYQGYENIALDELLKQYNEDEIISIRQSVPSIQYIQNNKKHYYYPDIFIPKDNLIIEVKSTYTYKLHLIKNILKALSVRKNGYNFELWIYDKNKEKIVI